jgi:hypothetical protein
MSALRLVISRLKSAPWATVRLAIVTLALVAGCAEEAVEEAPEDVEAARQRHIETMQREAAESQQ